MVNKKQEVPNGFKLYNLSLEIRMNIITHFNQIFTKNQQVNLS